VKDLTPSNCFKSSFIYDTICCNKSIYRYIHIRYFKSTVFIFILNRCYDILFLCYMTINRNQNHVTFLYIEFLLGYLNIDCEFEVQKKLWQNPDQLISMPMEYWTPYPWYIDPPTHGISTPLSMVYRPPYPIQLLTFNAVYSWLYRPGEWMIDRGQRPRLINHWPGPHSHE
jgi:hypothetical protein